LPALSNHPELLNRFPTENLPAIEKDQRGLQETAHMSGSPVETQIVSLHHVGFVVRSIQDSVDRFAKSIGSTWDGKIFLDPLQGARVTFLRSMGPALSCVELVEPAGEKSPVTNFLARGGGLHHLCYEVKSLDRQLEHSKSIGGVVVRPPLPAVAFEGRRIAWVFTRERLLLEFLETE
jgi:methylmalonyl-CoA/ethylmalonyl-CoA epimerase